MKHAILILQQEHVNLSKLLQLMRKLSEEMEDGESPDVPLLQEIAAYVSGYPEQCHHPKEDLIYRRLKERNPGALEKAADLLAEHANLSGLIARFNGALRSLGDAPEAEGKAFAATMRELVDAYEYHMEMEEKYFFPTAQRELTADDWAAIDYAVSEQDDPLFDAATSKYARIRDEVFQHAASHDERATAAASPGLADMQSINHFNVLQHARGTKLSLQAAADSGFELTDDGRVIFEIPSASEQRAAWCAFSYLAGRDS